MRELKMYRDLSWNGKMSSTALLWSSWRNDEREAEINALYHISIKNRLT